MGKKLSLLNKIPEGYKQTEIGVIPEDWDVKKLGDIAQVLTGNTPPTNDKSNYGEDYFFVSPADLGKSKYIHNTEKKLSKKGFNISRKFPPNSILFTCIGSTIGKLGITSIELTSNQQINAVLPNEKFSPDFLFYSLDYISPRIQSLAGEQAVPIVNKTEFKRTLITLPTIKSEQTAIATVLSDTDALIEKLEKLIAKKKAIKQGAMQQFLTGKKRLPGFSGKWKVKKLGEVGNCIRGVSYNGERDLSLYDTTTTVRLLRSNNVQGGTIDLIGLQYVNISRVKTIQALQKNDIVICMANGSKQLVGKSAIFDVLDIYNYTFGAFMGCFRVKQSQAVSRFISFTFQTYQYRSYIDMLLSGSSINNLKPSDIESIEIPYPKQEEQTAIATILSDMDSEIKKLEQKRDKYTMLKQGMMQQLLTGRIRIYANN